MKQDGDHFRREEQTKQLTLMFKIVHNETPGYLKISCQTESEIKHTIS